jgi:hypothetical protein
MRIRLRFRSAGTGDEGRDGEGEMNAQVERVAGPGQHAAEIDRWEAGMISNTQADRTFPLLPHNEAQPPAQQAGRNRPSPRRTRKDNDRSRKRGSGGGAVIDLSDGAMVGGGGEGGGGEEGEEGGGGGEGMGGSSNGVKDGGNGEGGVEGEGGIESKVGGVGGGQGGDNGGGTGVGEREQGGVRVTRSLRVTQSAAVEQHPTPPPARRSSRPRRG